MNPHPYFFILVYESSLEEVFRKAAMFFYGTKHNVAEDILTFINTGTVPEYVHVYVRQKQLDEIGFFMRRIRSKR